jgi:hypothetical protein
MCICEVHLVCGGNNLTSPLLSHCTFADMLFIYPGQVVVYIYILSIEGPTMPEKKTGSWVEQETKLTAQKRGSSNNNKANEYIYSLHNPKIQ